MPVEIERESDHRASHRRLRDGLDCKALGNAEPAGWVLASEGQTAPGPSADNPQVQGPGPASVVEFDTRPAVTLGNFLRTSPARIGLNGNPLSQRKHAPTHQQPRGTDRLVRGPHRQDV